MSAASKSPWEWDRGTGPFSTSPKCGVTRELLGQQPNPAMTLQLLILYNEIMGDLILCASKLAPSIGDYSASGVLRHKHRERLQANFVDLQAKDGNVYLNMNTVMGFIDEAWEHLTWNNAQRVKLGYAFTTTKDTPSAIPTTSLDAISLPNSPPLSSSPRPRPRPRPALPRNESESQVDTHKMSRMLTTVQQCWAEWATGVDGGPSLRDLEEQHGSLWRREQTERMFFSRRKPIYHEIQRRIDSGQQEEVALRQLEETRMRNHMSLNSLTNG